jgi:hypothetical protein
MVFNNSIQIIILVIFTIWLGFISYLVFRVKQHYNQLMAGVKGNTLTSAIDSLMASQQSLAKARSQIEKHIQEIENRAMFHIQEIGIVRFNPFSDTGGSQSFTLALLDGKQNGVVMTSLYARTGNRWYIKQVKEGKGVGLELSKEEESAIQKTKPISDHRNKYE